MTSDEGDMQTAALDVVVDRTMVNKRYDVMARYNKTYLQWGFHPCTDKEQKESLPTCREYIKVTGAPLVFYNQSSSEEVVVGVSTWSDCSSRKANYPVVFSYIVGHEQRLLECARLIAEDEASDPPPGYYDALCKAEVATPPDWHYELE